MQQRPDQPGDQPGARQIGHTVGDLHAVEKDSQQAVAAMNQDDIRIAAGRSKHFLSNLAEKHPLFGRGNPEQPETPALAGSDRPGRRPALTTRRIYREPIRNKTATFIEF